jgi:hypothetical protein
MLRVGAVRSRRLNLGLETRQVSRRKVELTLVRPKGLEK